MLRFLHFWKIIYNNKPTKKYQYFNGFFFEENILRMKKTEKHGNEIATTTAAVTGTETIKRNIRLHSTNIPKTMEMIQNIENKKITQLFEH